MGWLGWSIRCAVRLLLRLSVVHRRPLVAGACAGRRRRMDAAVRARAAAVDRRDSLLAEWRGRGGAGRRDSRSARCGNDLLRVPAGARGIPRWSVAAVAGSSHDHRWSGHSGPLPAHAGARALSEAVAHSRCVGGRPAPLDADAISRDAGHRHRRHPDWHVLHRRGAVLATTARPW